MTGAALAHPAPDGARRAHPALAGTCSLLAFIGVAWWLAHLIDWRAAWAAMRAASAPMLAAATLANLAAVLCGAFAWRVLLPARGARLLRGAMRATCAGFAASGLLPANSGAVVRIAVLVRETGVGSATATSALVVQRGLDALAAALVFALALPVIGVALPWRVDRGVAIAGLLAAALLLLVLRAPGVLRDWVRRTRLGLWLRDGWAAARAAATPRRLGGAFALSLTAWSLQLASYHLAARALGLSVTAATSLALLALTNLSFLVRVTPGNVGIFQLVFVAAAAMLGLPRTPAAATAVVLQVLQTVPVVALAGAVALSSRSHHHAIPRIP